MIAALYIEDAVRSLPFVQNIVRLYPDEPLLARPFENSNGPVGYRQDLED